jgi:hypothetical protein
MSLLAAVGIVMSLFLRDRVLDELRAGQHSEAGRELQAEPAD